MHYSNLLTFNIPHLQSLNTKEKIKETLDNSASGEYFIKQKAFIPEQKNMTLISRFSQDGILIYYVLKSESNIFTIETTPDFYGNNIIRILEQDYLQFAG